MRPQRSRGGYLIAILACALAVLTIGYLALAAYSSRVKDGAEASVAESKAYYAAESGLVKAEYALTSRGPESPPVGVWLTGQFPGGNSDFRLEVLAEARQRKKFRVRSVGRSAGEGDRVHSVEFGAEYVFQAGTGWKAVWRGRL